MRDGLLIFAAALAIMGAVIWFNRLPSPYADWPPEMRKEQEKIDAMVKANWDGELGQGARALCNARLSTPAAKTAAQVFDQYGTEKGSDWLKCVVNTMYPDPDPWRHPKTQ